MAHHFLHGGREKHFDLRTYCLANVLINNEPSLYFDQNLNLNEQKQKISNKIKDLDIKILGIISKLKNKSFLKNAPKHIVEKDKKALKDYKIDLKKLNNILNSIKN